MIAILLRHMSYALLPHFTPYALAIGDIIDTLYYATPPAIICRHADADSALRARRFAADSQMISRCFSFAMPLLPPPRRCCYAATIRHRYAIDLRRYASIFASPPLRRAYVTTTPPRRYAAADAAITLRHA